MQYLTYERIRACIDTHARTYTHTHTYTYAHMRISLCTPHAHVRVSACIDTHTHMRISLCTPHAHVRVNACIPAAACTSAVICFCSRGVIVGLGRLFGWYCFEGGRISLNWEVALWPPLNLTRCARHYRWDQVKIANELRITREGWSQVYAQRRNYLFSFNG